MTVVLNSTASTSCANQNEQAVNEMIERKVPGLQGSLKLLMSSQKSVKGKFLVLGGAGDWTTRLKLGGVRGEDP